MKVNKKLMTVSLLSGLLLILFLVSTAYGMEEGVRTRVKPGFGRYITNSNGIALYVYKKDSYLKSNCTGECVEKWQPYYADEIKSSLLNPENFGEITREDGTQQTTYKGLPLYYYTGDENRKDTNGHGIGNAWSLVRVKSFPHSEGYVNVLSPNPSSRSNNI